MIAVVWRRLIFMEGMGVHAGDAAARSMISAEACGRFPGQGLLVLPAPPPPKYSTFVSSMTAEP